MNTKRKKQILIGVVALIIIVGGIIGLNFYHRQQYEKKLIQTSEDMINLGADSEKVVNNYITIWSGLARGNYNYDWTRPYIATLIGIDPNEFVNNTSPLKLDDKALGFNDGLKCYKEYNVNTGVNDSIINRMNGIEKNISELNNPPSKYKESYNSLLDMYTNLKNFVDLTIDPSGSLISYRNDTGNLDTKVINDYDLFKTQLPNGISNKVSK